MHLGYMCNSHIYINLGCLNLYKSLILAWKDQTLIYSHIYINLRCLNLCKPLVLAWKYHKSSDTSSFIINVVEVESVYRTFIASKTLVELPSYLLKLENGNIVVHIMVLGDYAKKSTSWSLIKGSYVMRGWLQLSGSSFYWYYNLHCSKKNYRLFFFFSFLYVSEDLNTYLNKLVFALLSEVIFSLKSVGMQNNDFTFRV